LVPPAKNSLPSSVSWPLAASTATPVTVGAEVDVGGGVGTVTRIRVVSWPTSTGMMLVTGWFA